tara:strand:- start:927 stop:1115 length:189 start_codon:yes stop_codon:yes gene_type:complete
MMKIVHTFYEVINKDIYNGEIVDFFETRQEAEEHAKSQGSLEFWQCDIQEDREYIWSLLKVD